MQPRSRDSIAVEKMQQHEWGGESCETTSLANVQLKDCACEGELCQPLRNAVQ